MTTSSSEQLPARSPRPLMVHSTWRAPPIFTPANELATAMPGRCGSAPTRWPGGIG